MKHWLRVLLAVLATLPFGWMVTAPALAESVTPPTAAAATVAVQTPALRSAAAASRVIEVTFSVRVENVDSQQRGARDVTITVPPAVLNMTGHQRVVSVRFEPEPTSVEQTPAGAQAHYVISDLAAGRTLVIRQIYQVELFAGHTLASAGAATVAAEGTDPQYLAPEPGVESDNPQIRAQALELTQNAATAAAKAEAIMGFVTTHIRYNASAPARNQGALAGFTSREGVCTEYASLFVAMARASGIPARVVYGWAKDARGDAVLRGDLDGTVRHAWAEYFDPGRGWVSVDPTYAAVRPADARMQFDGLNHLAQDFAQQPLKAQYRGGRVAFSVGTFVQPAVHVATQSTVAVQP